MILTSSWIVDLIILLLIPSFLLFKYSTRKFNYWRKRGIYNPKPIPFLGNFSDVCFFKCTIGEWLKKIYDSVNEPYFGIFVFDQPCMIIKSPELIKHITIGDFEYFTDRTMAFPKHEEIQSNMLFLQKAPEWRYDRTKLTPVFTSGKLKGMFSIVDSIGGDLVRFVGKHQDAMDAKEACAKYSTDVSARCFFGINSHCFDDHNATFRKIGRSVFDFSWRNAIVQSAYLFKPWWVNIFHLDLINSSVRDYFSGAISKTMKQREETQIRKNDFIDILRDLERSNGSTDCSDSVSKKIIGHALQFYAAGFETVSSTIAFTLHECCLNRNIQNKLRKEIMTNIEENGGITYEGMQEMKYLSMCISETLRKYPVLPFLDRMCNEDYKIPGTEFVIQKGMIVYIPLYGLQLDEKYFPEPEKYNPDRFSNSNNINGNGRVYMPFGEGPRNCIGERFGLLSTKMALIHILSNFEVEKCATTPDPVKFAPKSLVLQSTVGLPMKFNKIIPNPS